MDIGADCTISSDPHTGSDALRVRPCGLTGQDRGQLHGTRSLNIICVQRGGGK